MSFRAPASAGAFANYAEFVTDPFAVEVLIDTLRLGVGVVLGTTLLGLPIALLYWHAGRRLRVALIFLVLLPMLTSNVVRTFAWIVILGRQGPISQSLVALGLADSPTTLLFTDLGVVLSLCQIDLPLLLLPVLAVIGRIDERIVDAAKLAGAGPWRIFMTIMLPLAMPGLLAGWVLVFASATTSFVTQSVIGGARHIYLPQLIYRHVGILFEWPYAATAAMLLLLSTGCVLVLLAAVTRHRRLLAHA
jgi:putative spermidine/putrescine transport system permease protein